ncbi:hypothetical protein LCGC14_2720810, partial [marine sediment metagenome]
CMLNMAAGGGCVDGLEAKKQQAKTQGNTKTDGGNETPSVSVKIEFGFDGGLKSNDVDLQNFETKSQTINVDGEGFNYNTLGPKGFDTQVKRSLTSIAKTDAGKKMLKSITKGGQSLLIQFGPNNGAGIADGYDAGIVFNPKKRNSIHTNKGTVNDSPNFALAHEVFHVWGPMTRGYFGGNDRIKIGDPVRGLGAMETYAVRYTNRIRLQSGANYQRTHYLEKGTLYAIP